MRLRRDHQLVDLYLALPAYMSHESEVVSLDYSRSYT